jgi:DNA-binding HxlR family transcriptional regulator
MPRFYDWRRGRSTARSALDAAAGLRDGVGMRGYGQFCPVAQAAEVLAERWTPLVLRELVYGSRRFNDIHRGVPLMSSSLLVRRLRTLEAAGVVERVARENGHGHEYVLTTAGEELRPLVELLGLWGERWLRREIDDEDADAALLMWAVRRSVVPRAKPAERTVVHFRFSDAPPKKRFWWLVLTPGENADLCLSDPGHGIDLTVRTDPRTLARIYMGDTGLARALHERTLGLEGPEHLVRGFPRWFGLSPLARIDRPGRSMARAV